MVNDLETSKATELALQFAAQRGRDRDGANFFEAIALFLTETLGVSYAFVAELDHGDEPLVTTLGLAENQSIHPNISYPLAGSPCANVISKGACQHSSGIQTKYPDDPMLVDLDVQAYVGVVLPSLKDEPVGHIAIIHTEEMTDTETAKQVLSILSTCAAWEIEHLQYEKQIKKSESRFRDFAEASSDWYWEMDTDFKISYISPNVSYSTGIPASFHIGKTRQELSGASTDTKAWSEHLKTLDKHEPFKDFEYVRLGPDNILDHIRTSGVPVFGDDGEFMGYRGTGSRITDEKELQNALSQSDARYERAMQHAAIWEWDIPKHHFFVSPRLREMLGYDEAEFNGIIEDSLRTLVHPDDLPGYLERLNTALAFPETIYESEQRLRQKSGHYKWFETKGRVAADENGEAIQMSGLIMDITDRKEMETSLSDATERAIRAERRLLGAVNSLKDAFAIYDAEDKLVMFNEAYRKDRARIADLIKPGTTFEEVIRASIKQGRFPEALGREEEWIQERLQDHRNADRSIEHRLDDGRWMRVSEQKTPDGDTVGVRVDVTLFKQAQEIAENANKAKSEFLSSMSHELRTPLNAILGFGQLLRNDGKNPLSDAQKRAVKHILNSGSHLLTLIDEVLDLAKVEAGQERMSIENTDMSDVIESCMSLVQSTADEYGIQIIEELDTECSTVLADYTRMKQVIVNLLTNAIKYNDENGTVTLATECLGGKTRVTVTDTGPGIPAEKHEELFQPFCRLGAETTEIEGTGIGLTICKRLIELMDGSIGVESKLGEGSTFWIELPTATEPTVTAVPIETVVPQSITQKSAPTSASGHFGVLYVEDNPTNIRLMEQIIDLVPDAELTSTHTAENALEMVSSLDPDLILMDINLPGMNGIQALNRLKASPDTASKPVIAISADAIPESIQRGLEAGFHAYLTKPIRVDEILDIIESIRTEE